MGTAQEGLLGVPPVYAMAVRTWVPAAVSLYPKVT